MLTYKTITFDDITTEDKAPIPDGYEGFAWVAFDPYHNTYGGDVYAATGGNALTSGTHSVKGLGFQMKLKESGTFYVKSAVLAADTGAAINMSVRVIGRLEGMDIFSKQFYDEPGPIEVEINCNGIDEVVIFGSAIETFDLDNLVVAIRKDGGEGV